MSLSDEPFTLESDSMPAEAWDEGLVVASSSGKNLESEGSVKLAMRMLGIKDKSTFYLLIKSGHVIARKKRHTARANSPYVVDLMSVWRYKQEGLRAAAG